MASENTPLLRPLMPELSGNLQTSIEDSQENKSQEPSRKGLLGKVLKVVHGPERLWSVIYASFVAVIGALMFGYTMGYASPVLLELSDPTFIKEVSNANFTSTDVYTALFGAFVPLGAAIGGITFGTVADFLGRRQAMMVCGIPFFIGFLLIALSRLTTGAGFYGLILTGRLLSGYSCGSASLVVPMYISEISPPGLRGLLGTLFQFAVVVGIGLVYGLGAIPVTNDFYSSLSYEYLAAVVCVIVVVYEVLLFTVKESPSWLIRKKYEDAASNSLRWFRGPKVKIDKEVETLTKSIHRQDVSTVHIFKLFRKRTVWKPLILTGLVMFFQQFSGVNAIIFYSGSIFQSANVKKPALVATGAVGGIQIAATLVCVLLTDLVGRRWLLMIGSAGMVVSTATMGVYFFLVENFCRQGSTVVATNLSNATLGVSLLPASNATISIVCGTSFSALAITSVAVYMIVFSLGWGAIPWLLSAEMFPMLVRGKCMSIATFLNWIFVTIITAAYQKYANTVTPYGAFWSFTVVMVVSFFFVLIFLPETKGKSLQEIEAKFAGSHAEDIILENEGDNVVNH